MVVLKQNRALYSGETRSVCTCDCIEIESNSIETLLTNESFFYSFVVFNLIASRSIIRSTIFFFDNVPCNKFYGKHH